MVEPMPQFCVVENAAQWLYLAYANTIATDQTRQHKKTETGNKDWLHTTSNAIHR